MNKQIYLKNITKSGTYPKILLSGYANVPNTNEHFKRCATEWIMYVVEHGHMIICEDDQTYDLHAGDVIVFTPGRTHWGIKQKSDVSYFYIHFSWKGLEEEQLSNEEYILYMQTIVNNTLENGENIDTDDINDAMENIFLVPKFSHPTPANYTEILTLINKILLERKNGFLNHTVIENGILHIILTLINRTNFEKHMHITFNNDFIPELIIYLRNNIKEKITSTTLEKEMNHSFDYMNRVFHKTIGITIFKYLLKLRLEESKKLLNASHLSIADIAEQTGFCNAYYFSSVFKKNEGITPGNYRKESR